MANTKETKKVASSAARRGGGKKVFKKMSAARVAKNKIASRKLVVRKIVAKKAVSVRKRKAKMEKIVTISPKASVKSYNLFFTHDFMRHVALTIILVLGVASFGRLGITNAFYNDIETSSGNSWWAGALDFVISDSGFVPSELALNLEPGTTTSKTVGMSLEPDSNPIKYHASTTNFIGDVSFCEGIDLDASLDGQNQFSGKLKDFISPATTTISSWNYGFSMPANSDFYNKVCTFNFEYNGRQTAPHNEYEDGGYYDLETATSTIYSWGFRINKVYYDVASDRGVETANEWVEIYNQTDQPIDIADWQICDNTGCDTFASTSPIMIPAKGFAVVTATSTTWDYWELANNVVPVVLNSQIGGGLANSADMLILKRPDGVIIDQMNWGTPVSTWDNFNSEVWNPGAVDVPEGHTLGRRPNGYDTNQASDFVDLAPPVLNLINPDQSGSLTWYWTYNYNILWTAVNLNGPDSALKINLSYLKDTDGSNTMTPSDESVVIASDLENTGSYSWDLPSGFLGYIWVKITAFGPENPMLNTFMISGKIYDPFLVDTFLLDLREEPEEEVLGAMTPALPEDMVEDEVVIVEESPVTVQQEEAETVATTTPEVVVEPAVEPVVAEPIAESTEISSEVAEEPVIEEEPIIIDEPVVEPEPVTPATETESVTANPPAPVEAKEPEPEPVAPEEVIPVVEPVVPEVMPVVETVAPTPEPEVVTP